MDVPWQYCRSGILPPYPAGTLHRPGAQWIGPRAVIDAADAFFERFYTNFLARPGVEPLFDGTDMSRQAQMLRKSFFHLVTFQMLNEPTPELERLGAVHARQGVPVEMFDVWLDALLTTIAEFDPEFCETTRLAWCWALAPGISYVKSALLQEQTSQNSAE